MVMLILRRLASMVLIMVVISFILFVIFEGDKDLLARKALGAYVTQDQVDIWMERNGLNEPFFYRYFAWMGNLLTGDLGTSLTGNYKGTPVAELMAPRLAATGLLALLVFAVMVPLSLLLGVLAGMKEGSLQDRVISVISIITTAIPEFASATFLVSIFVYWLGLLPGTSAMTSGFSWAELVLPVTVLVLYGFGYITRMTRASMAEVMTSQYIRTAVLKGLPQNTVIWQHALRNALIAPFTVIILQLNWLLSGVIVTEVYFSYNGFGRLLYDSAVAQDVYTIEACTLVAVFVAVMTQLISDIGYTYLNPRIRFS